MKFKIIISLKIYLINVVEKISNTGYLFDDATYITILATIYKYTAHLNIIDYYKCYWHNLHFIKEFSSPLFTAFSLALRIHLLVQTFNRGLP